jgi:hypothetical protein
MIRECLPHLAALGISHEDASALRRIAMTLHRWAELECGNERGAIERDETTGKPYWTYDAGANGKRGRVAIPDRERGAEKRLAKIMAKYPTLSAYIQGDCRGAPLYILKPGDVPEGQHAESYYSRGVAVYK